MIKRRIYVKKKKKLTLAELEKKTNESLAELLIAKEGELNSKIKPGFPGRPGMSGRPGISGVRGIPGRPGKDVDINWIKKELDGLKKENLQLKETIKKLPNADFFKKDAKNYFSENLKKNIEITSVALKKMPDFRKLAMGLQGQIDQLKNPIVIDLDSQCDGVTTEFNIGTTIGPILFVNNNGGILTRSEWSRSGSTLTLVYAPDSGEELEVIGLRNT